MLQFFISNPGGGAGGGKACLFPRPRPEALVRVGEEAGGAGSAERGGVEERVNVGEWEQGWVGINGGHKMWRWWL